MKGNDWGPAVRCWKAGIFLTMLMPCQSGFAGTQREHEGAEKLRMTVRVYDYARVPGGTFAAAEAEATRILRKAGIETVWAECTVAQEQMPLDPVCQQEFGPTDLHLIVPTRAMALRLDFRDAEFGRAPAPTEIAPGAYTRVFYVFCDRVKALVEGRDITEAQILGHAIAHEIGHVLLPELGHTSAGIMRARWNGKDLESVARGNLLFAPAEAQGLRAAVLARANPPHPSTAAASPLAPTHHR